MRGSIVEGKCSSSDAASLKLRRISSRETEEEGLRNQLSQRDRSALCQEDRQTFLVVVCRTITLGVVHGLDIHMTRA